MATVTKVRVIKGHDGKFYASAFARNGKSIETFGQGYKRRAYVLKRIAAEHPTAKVEIVEPTEA